MVLKNPAILNLVQVQQQRHTSVSTPSETPFSTVAHSDPITINAVTDAGEDLMDSDEVATLVNEILSSVTADIPPVTSTALNYSDGGLESQVNVLASGYPTDAPGELQGIPIGIRGSDLLSLFEASAPQAPPTSTSSYNSSTLMASIGTQMPLAGPSLLTDYAVPYPQQPMTTPYLVPHHTNLPMDPDMHMPYQQFPSVVDNAAATSSANYVTTYSREGFNKRDQVCQTDLPSPPTSSKSEACCTVELRGGSSSSTDSVVVDTKSCGNCCKCCSCTEGACSCKQ